jgi:hypothetical protein
VSETLDQIEARYEARLAEVGDLHGFETEEAVNAYCIRNVLAAVSHLRMCLRVAEGEA